MTMSALRVTVTGATGLIGSAVLVIIGVTLITLAPAKQPAERASTVA